MSMDNAQRLTFNAERTMTDRSSTQRAQRGQTEGTEQSSVDSVYLFVLCDPNSE